MSCPECGSWCDEECYADFVMRLDLLERYVIAQTKADRYMRLRGPASKHTQRWQENATEARERITWIDAQGKYAR